MVCISSLLTAPKRPARFKINSVSLTSVLPLPRFTLIFRLRRWKVISLLQARNGRITVPTPHKPHGDSSNLNEQFMFWSVFNLSWRPIIKFVTTLAFDGNGVSLWSNLIRIILNFLGIIWFKFVFWPTSKAQNWEYSPALLYCVTNKLKLSREKWASFFDDFACLLKRLLSIRWFIMFFLVIRDIKVFNYLFWSRKNLFKDIYEPQSQ